MGNSFYHDCLVRLGRVLMYFRAFSLPMYLRSYWDGVPKMEMILWIWSRKSYPGNRGVLPRSSAIMQPTDQMSTAFEYSLAFNITSGALYHLVTTYSVFSSYSSVYPLANPKSQIFKSHFLFNSKLLGFKSLCRILAECMNNNPLSN